MYLPQNTLSLVSIEEIPNQLFLNRIQIIQKYLN